jgi:hypothetical protein
VRARAERTATPAHEVLLLALTLLRPHAPRCTELLRLHLHFAKQPATVASVLAAQGPLWAINALQRFAPGHRTHEPALALLSALGGAPAAQRTLLGPTPRGWGAEARGAQRMSGELARARAAAAASADDDSTRVVHVHCGGAKAASRKRLAALNADGALLAELTRRCVADANGAPSPSLSGAPRTHALALPPLPLNALRALAPRRGGAPRAGG